MNVKKKLISFSRRLCILSLCVVIGLAVSLQGFCANTNKVVMTCTVNPDTGTITDGGYSPSQQRSFAIKNINYTSLTVDFWTHEMNTFPAYNENNTYHISFYYDIVCRSKTNYLNPSNCYVTLLFDEVTGTKQLVYPTRYNHSDAYGYRLFYDFTLNTSYSTIQFQFLSIYLSFNTNMGTVTTNHAISPLTFTISTGTDKVIEQFGSNYSKPNTSDVDNYNNAESQLYNGVASSLDDINSQWKNINGDLLQYQGAFLAVNNFFNNLTGLDWIKVVLILSVSIGMFALLLGAVNSVFKSRGD